MSEDKCKGCGARIVWGFTADDKWIPLDPRPPVYFITLAKLENTSYLGKAGDEIMLTERAKKWDSEEGVGYMVSHFATCPKASEFSGGREK